MQYDMHTSCYLSVTRLAGVQNAPCNFRVWFVIPEFLYCMCQWSAVETIRYLSKQHTARTWLANIGACL